ncbi:SDR family NAD(P)-dependent oxidoreductase [Pelagerythrobacter rhizovicinus]|uniref:SDR family NAD(P)-dependent oxidoreductase n=1 Tax=Pelagerythrobacter rhizovicinus TaxID=2268576 RepID=A0A4Q2KLY4_9SPHN|nr:SDR family NAD(P)-dependent oxidoreductase [Pelagerythrobacter rhizovicinus]RXZ66338.1 SDR family NAD(P)-dependent oxidoreductase [Pelagerythrobacter rhizovicinus]
MQLHFGLTGRNYLITGANSGIGRAIAIALGVQGANVAVHYLPATAGAPSAAHPILGVDAALEVVETVRRFGANAATLAADLSSESDVAAPVSEAEQAVEPLDGLVNNAAACELPDSLSA